MEKVHLRNDGYFWHVCVADLFSRRKIWWLFVTCDQYGSSAAVWAAEATTTASRSLSMGGWPLATWFFASWSKRERLKIHFFTKVFFSMIDQYESTTSSQQTLSCSLMRGFQIRRRALVNQFLSCFLLIPAILINSSWSCVVGYLWKKIWSCSNSMKYGAVVVG